MYLFVYLFIYCQKIHFVLFFLLKNFALFVHAGRWMWDTVKWFLRLHCKNKKSIYICKLTDLGSEYLNLIWTA